ncbi:ATP-binding protein [Streptomyces sp. NPDC048751]|uniref:ATP-binding protein n=1 Tax=Streptomyces sp. NPDC048751 TaxID=3365591 RepID=UPI0037123DFA
MAGGSRPRTGPVGGAGRDRDRAGRAGPRPRPVRDRLADHLAGRRTLLVLDNCEHLADACARLAQSLLGAAPGLRVLATSRATLGLTGESVLTVPPLSVPDEAVELVRDRAAAVRPSFRITEANREAVTRLCARLDGLPLAIELAATRLRTLTVDQLMDRLEDRFGLLTAGSSTARPHQRTLRALIDWSHELCSPPEQLLWRRLSVFAGGGFDLDAAEDVCCGDGLPRGEILDRLDRLVAQSVVLTSEDESRPQYRMLETIREYGRGRLAESGEERPLLRRHRDYFRALAESSAAAWYGPGQEEALARLRAQHGNLRLALEYDGADPGHRQAALVLVAALRFHWCADGFLGEGRDRIERALAAAPEPTAARAGALWAGAWAALLQEDHRTADRWLTEADELGERLGDPVIRAYVQGLRGTSALFVGRLDEAVSLYEGAVSAQIAAGEGPGALFSLFQLSVARAHLGDPRAAESGRRAVAAAEEHGERGCRSYALWALGHDAWVRGDTASALTFTRAGLEIQRGFNDYAGTALMLELLAWITASDGDRARAGRLLGAIRALWRKIGTGITAFGPHLAEHHTRCEETVVRALGTAGYERALAEGGGHDVPGPAIADALGAPVARAEPAADADPLSRREREVALLVARGMSNRRIAAELVLSPRTVDGHVEHILAKLGFRSRTEIAAWVAAHKDQVPTP